VGRENLSYTGQSNVSVIRRCSLIKNGQRAATAIVCFGIKALAVVYMRLLNVPLAT